MPKRKKAPAPIELLDLATADKTKPFAVVLAGHNGSGKTTLWIERLSSHLEIPLINADRLTESILPTRDEENRLPGWAQQLRDTDERWQMLSQRSVRAVRSVAIEMRLPFAFETVFSHWKLKERGGYESKADDILEMQKSGYIVILLFVGLQTVDISMASVASRRAQGGHHVPYEKLISRFPRTQKAIGHASTIADMTLMFDNTRRQSKAFVLARAQRKNEILFDCRDQRYKVDPALVTIATPWLDNVAGKWLMTDDR